MPRFDDKKDYEFYKNEIKPKNEQPEWPRICESDARLGAGIIVGLVAYFVQDYFSFWNSETSLIASVAIGALMAIFMH